jgi:hypothetical protein
MNSNPSRLTQSIMIALTLALVPCFLSAQEGATDAPPVPESQRVALTKLLPEPGPLQAAPQGEPQFYGGNLWEYIDGGADAFHQYDFVALINQSYKAGGADVTVDIYDMGAPANAYGIYSSERSADATFLPFGAEGYLSEYSLNFTQAGYYVKLQAFAKDGKVDEALKAFAGAVSARMGGARSTLAAFALFPAQDRIPRSERFILKTPLGHEYLGPAYLVRYARGGKEGTLYLSEAADVDAAKRRADHLAEHFTKSGTLTARDTVAAGARLGVNSYEDPLLFAASGRFVVLLAKPTPETEALFKECLVGLH